MHIIHTILIIATLGGCSTQSPSEKDEWYRQIDKENLSLCLEAYKEAGAPTWSRHHHSKHKKHRPSDVKQDLFDNNCRQVLGDSYIEK